MIFTTSFLLTFKELLEAALLIFAILRTRDSVAEKSSIVMGILIGVLLFFGAFTAVHLLAVEFEKFMLPITALTVVALFYFARPKSEITSWRTRWLVDFSRQQSLKFLAAAIALIVFREGLEVIVGTAALAVTSPQIVLLGIGCGALTIFAFSSVIHALSLKISQKAIFRFCNWTFILMALYYSWEIVMQYF